MKAITTAGDMLKAVACVRRFVPRQIAMPIFTRVKIVAENKQVTIEGGSFGEWARAGVVGANVRADGVCVVHGETLYALLSKMPQATPITIASVMGRCQILGQSREASLPTEDPEQYPAFDGQGTQVAALFPIDTLRDALRETLPCVAPDNETRYVLTYVRFNLHGQTLDVEATNGRCAAVYKTDIPYKGIDFNLLVPGNALRKFLAATRLIPGTAFVSISTGGGFTIGVSDIDVTMRPFEGGTTCGKFPNLQGILPKRFVRSV
ncbi:MAG: hypothetical protein LLG24_07460, partial [Actinomycetia bacterium]|nr:hypothetical protein [Actinomycetes bacterium]